jgi:hypothetical protein
MYFVLCKIFPIKRAGMQDDTDIYGTFSEADAEQKGIQPFLSHKAASLEGVEATGPGPIEASDLEKAGLPQTDAKSFGTVPVNGHGL